MMKTLMKQGFLLAAVLLVATILVTGCFSEPEGYTPPDGMGAVRLNLTLDNPNARATIMPDDADIETFEQFRLTIVPTVTGVDGLYTLTDLEDPISLPPNNYTVSIIAYMDAGATQAAAATPTPVPFPVNVPPTATPGVSVVLKAYDPAASTGNGTFAWAITYNVTALTAATMTVTPIGPPTPPPDPITGLDGRDITGTGGSGSQAVPAGYYYVDFSVTGGSPAVTRAFRHILQIYIYQTSTFSYTFDDTKLGIVSAEVTITPTYLPPEDLFPVVTPAPNANGEIEVSLTGGAVDLTVTNVATFTGTGASITWWYGSTSLGNGSPWTVNKTIFNTLGRYAVTVIGTTPEDPAVLPDLPDPYANKPYSTEIFIRIIP